MRIALIAAIAIGVAIPASGATQRGEVTVYPAMRHAGVAYAVRTGADGKIVACQPVDGTPTKAQIDTACAALTAKGVPAAVTPARATNDPRRWVTYDDYPRAVQAKTREGALELVYEISEAGRVTDCHVFVTSGDPEIDKVVCASIMARARFSPASYKGQPVRAIGTNFFTFDIPGA